MTTRELLVLSPYQLPGRNPLMVGTEEEAAILNGYTALWHPAALVRAAGPPRLVSPYDHEQPTAGHLYAVPVSPPLLLPEDWHQRVNEAKALAFRSQADRTNTLANLQVALLAADDPGALGQPAKGARLSELCALPSERVEPFFGIGLGYLVVSTLFEAMEHEHVLAVADFWTDVQLAVASASRPDPEESRKHLQAAADRLRTARDVVYPAAIHLIDIHVLDDQRPLPASLEKALPINLVASGSYLERLEREQPAQLALLRERLAANQAEVCGGSYVEREDPLLPIESQIWNLLKGLSVSRACLGQEIRVYARRRFGFQPQTPMLLNAVGLRRVLALALDDAVLPSFRGTVTRWSAPDGKQVDAFARTPHPTDSPQTFFHLAHYLHQTIMQDQAATLVLLHKDTPPAAWYGDLRELGRLGPVLGEWTTLTRYFNDVYATDDAGTPSVDEFHADFLSEGSPGNDVPVSGFARHTRQRRLIDTSWTLAGIYRSLTADRKTLPIEARLAEAEGCVETGSATEAEIQELLQETGSLLAGRLLARAPDQPPGYLVLNPCSFARRVTLELPAVEHPFPLAGPVKACQVDGEKTRLVVEVPALGFSWIPRSGSPGTPAMAARLRLADAHHVRNEFFEAEIDPATGGLRGFCDPRTRVNRMGQQLVFNPGSRMRVSEVKVTSTGPAVGEVVSEGALVNDQDETLATFRQRFRAWLGRPILEMRIEIYPRQAPEGYPWHSYYGSRFAWRDERALLLRGVNGSGSITSHTRPETPDYLEWRMGRTNTILFPGGLPFHQRHGTRMLDVLLIAPGESSRAFELALGLDRDYPMQTALGIVTPVPVVPVSKGPPPGGSSSWLFHLDAPQLLLTGLRPAPAGEDGIRVRLLECGVSGGHAELRCVRPPQSAMILDARGELLQDMHVSGDAALLEVARGDWMQVRVDFG
jgi:hypothetical protein